MVETVVARIRPAIRYHLGALFLILIMVAGAIALMFIEAEYNWYGSAALGVLALGYYGLLVLKTKTRKLEVTPTRTVLTVGFIARRTSEVLHSHVRNITSNQTIKGRVLGIGDLGISSAGQDDIEIEIKGVKMADVEKVKRAIEDNRQQERQAPVADSSNV